MSLSVNGSNSNNPYATLQSLLQQGSAQPSSSRAQSDPLAELLASARPANRGRRVSGEPVRRRQRPGRPSTSGSTIPQFGPQTLQALLDLQTSPNASPSQSVLSQLDGDDAADGTDPASGQQTQQTQDEQGHHHHHHMGGSAGAADGQNAVTAAASGATSQTTAGANGSSTTTITYADGSTVTMTTPGTSDASGGPTSSSGKISPANSNLIEQLIQMQSQLPQSRDHAEHRDGLAEVSRTPRRIGA